MSGAPEKPCFICGFSKAKEQKLINQGVEKAANLIRDYKISIVDDETGETGFIHVGEELAKSLMATVHEGKLH